MALCRSRVERFLWTVAELQQLARAQQLSGYLANNLSNEVRFPKCSARITQDCTVPTPLVFPVPCGLDLEPVLERKGPVSFFLACHMPAVSPGLLL